jgi:hypothetical protein
VFTILGIMIMAPRHNVNARIFRYEN